MFESQGQMGVRIENRKVKYLVEHYLEFFVTCSRLKLAYPENNAEHVSVPATTL